MEARDRICACIRMAWRLRTKARLEDEGTAELLRRIARKAEREVAELLKRWDDDAEGARVAVVPG